MKNTLIALLALVLSACGKSGSGPPPPPHHGYGGIIGSWDCQGNIYCQNNLADSQRQQHLEALRVKLNNPQNFASSQRASHSYQNCEGNSVWKRALGIGNCYRRRDKGDGSDTFQRSGAGADTSHLQRIANASQFHSLQNGVYYVIENNTTMYGINFSYSAAANPICRLNSDCTGYSLIGTSCLP